MEIVREEYLKKIRPYYDVKLIKVITGIRRAGKSVFLKQIIKEIREKYNVDEKHIIYIGFEDLDYAYISDAIELHNEIKNRIKDNDKYYIFLDEIQHIHEFEKGLDSIFSKYNVSMFVTGSNSKLLSGELATLLTGRTVEFEIMPFSYSEFVLYVKENKLEIDNIFDNYLKYGGFPLRLQFNKEEEIRKYLENLYTGIVNIDILNNQANFPKKQFMDIALYVLANAGNELSVEKIVNYYFEKNKVKLARNTIYSYLERMQKSYLIHAVKKYNLLGKEALNNNEKYYAIDTGLRIINTNTINYTKNFYLENIIYNELIFRGYTVFVGKLYNNEVDFVVIKDGKKCYIQVCYLLGNDETIEREFGVYKKIKDSTPKYVFSLDNIDMSTNEVIHINIEDFLLNKKSIILN